MTLWKRSVSLRLMRKTDCNTSFTVVLAKPIKVASPDIVPSQLLHLQDVEGMCDHQHVPSRLMMTVTSVNFLRLSRQHPTFPFRSHTDWGPAWRSASIHPVARSAYALQWLRAVRDLYSSSSFSWCRGTLCSLEGFWKRCATGRASRRPWFDSSCTRNERSQL